MMTCFRFTQKILDKLEAIFRRRVGNFKYADQDLIVLECDIIEYDFLHMGK